MEQRRKRLIEVGFPLEEVSEHSRREKNIRHGHISTLHNWWARRPLAACRAFIYASLVDDPGDEAERAELLKEVADLASWDAVRTPEKVVRTKANGGSGLTGHELLRRARQRILDSNGGVPPKLLDPFAGGGAIPLEGLRLGCEVEASDLNPVAVLILKGTVEYPQKYGQPESRYVPDYIRQAARGPQASFGDGDLVSSYVRNPLATDVRYWGNWMLEHARGQLADLYPPEPDGSVPVAYLWSRTVPCPSCGAEMPLIRQYWLARKDNKKVALEPVVDRNAKTVDFKVVEGPNVSGDPAEATMARGDTRCLVCGQTVKAEYTRAAGVRGEIGAKLTAVVLEASGVGGKRYRPDNQRDAAVFERAHDLVHTLENETIGDLPALPSEPIAYDPQNLKVRTYGMMTWRELFNARQLVVLTTFARLVHEAHASMLTEGLDEEYARAVTTYLGLAVDRLADWYSALCRWIPVGEKVGNTFARQALPMVWDYTETNALFGESWSFEDSIWWITENIRQNSKSASSAAAVQLADARSRSGQRLSAVVTDPPYYDAINYADLSDYFYVWLKRSTAFLHPDTLGLPLTPKRDQVVMNVYADGPKKSTTPRDQARQHYVDGMAKAFSAMSASLEPDGVVGVVFAHTDADAWSTLLEGLLHAGLVPDASWPIDTEREGKVSNLGQARLKTSVWMSCRPRSAQAGEAFLGDVLQDMRPVIRERLLDFWSKGIRGADFFISAIGPALSVFGRHARVLRPDGRVVSVRDFLDIVRQVSTDLALEQVLEGADLGVIDPSTRSYVTWVWSYSRAPLDSGDVHALGLATGTDYRQVVGPEAIAAEAKEKSKKVVRLRTIRDRALKDDTFGEGSAARPTPLIEQLQRAAWLWKQQPDQLPLYRGELGETRWSAMRTLGQAVAECLPTGDEDRQMIQGLLGSNVMAAAAPPAANGRTRVGPGMEPLPGFERVGE